jgi:hypothetical protein
MSRNKREGYYAGKHEGKHYRTPLTTGPSNLECLIEAVRKEYTR